jgi:Ca-activated chloride channel family protein
MQWEKLERSYQALESLLRTLRPSDRFNLLLFNNQVQTLQPAPVAAEPATVQHALDFVRSSKLRGGTDLQLALQTGLQQCSASAAASPYLILLSDGGATRGPIQNSKLASWYAESWKHLPENQRPRTYIFGVGDDANLPLLSVLARQDGLLEQVLSTEPAEFKLNSFLSKIGRSPIGELNLTVAPESAVDTVYPLQDSIFAGSLASWVGRYQASEKNVTFTVRGVRDGASLEMSAKAN